MSSVSTSPGRDPKRPAAGVLSGGASDEAAPPLVEIEPPDSLGDVVFARLRDAIIDRSLAPGARITEGDLSVRLGVSRTPVRETLWRLRQMGLIESVGRKGYQVALPSRKAIEQAYELRDALEVFAAGLAGLRASDAELKAIEAAAAASLRGAENGDMAEFRRWDGEFHDLICQASGNPRLQTHVTDTWALVITLRERDYLYDLASVACGSAHVAIAEAMGRRDREQVERLMRAHIRQVCDYVLEADTARVEREANEGINR